MTAIAARWPSIRFVAQDLRNLPGIVMDGRTRLIDFRREENCRALGDWFEQVLVPDMADGVDFIRDKVLYDTDQRAVRYWWKLCIYRSGRAYHITFSFKAENNAVCLWAGMVAQLVAIVRTDKACEDARRARPENVIDCTEVLLALANQ